MSVGFATPGLAYAILLLALLVSLAGLWTVGPPLRRTRTRLQERFLWGVPWGTVLCVVGLLVVYLFVQRGFWHWHRPVIVAYTAASIFDPVGWLLAGFAHTTPSHLRGNLTTTIVFAPIIEYVWSHYPRANGAGWEPDWFRRPLVRAVVLFPLGVGLIGVLTALFSWGPVIGFSVAAFALVGCSLVHYPLLTLAGLAVRSGVRVLWRTIADPVVFAETSVRVSRPGWAGVAVQGHLIGLLLGVLVGIALVRYHDRRVDPTRIWVAAVFVGLFLALWAVWWVLGPEQFVLFRGVGVGLVLIVAALVALAASPATSLPSVSIDVQRVAVAVILVSVIAMGVVGIGLNLAVVESPDRPVAMSVEDYDIYYAEGIPNGMVGIVDLDGFGLSTDVRTSGVIVVSEDRNVWRQTVSAAELRTHGFSRFYVGGIGWSEEVSAVRRGWVPVGNESVYHVWIGDGDEYASAYASEPRTATAVLAEHHFTLVADDATFYVEVTHEGDVETVAVPADGETVSVHDIELFRDGRDLIARSDGTRIAIAQREEYR